jgi:hypothetical protein
LSLFFFWKVFDLLFSLFSSLIHIQTYFLIVLVYWVSSYIYIMTTVQRDVYNPLLFEVAWEVANKGKVVSGFSIKRQAILLHMGLLFLIPFI